jgi:hypothetical protein
MAGCYGCGFDRWYSDGEIADVYCQHPDAPPMYEPIDTIERPDWCPLPEATR